jgi:hypothetical protein
VAADRIKLVEPPRRVLLLRDSLLIAAAGLLASLLLIANPGFYNPDELQKFDYIQNKGLAGYLRDYSHLRHWPHFAYPLRPLGFVVQGLFAWPMGSFPALTHLADVLLHCGIAIVLYRLLVLGAGATRALGLTAALLFACSPLATFAVGWSAAVMDPLYTGFSLLGIAAALRYLHKPAHHRLTLLLAAFWFTCAVLSKETALIVPVLLLALLWLDAPPSASLREKVTVLLTAAIPAAAYLLYRTPELVASLSGAGGGHYALGWTNAAYNLLVYLSYPFLPQLPEAGNIRLLHAAWPLAGLSLHAILWSALARYFGIRRALQYLVLYLVPLVPILALAGKGSHYLYASAVPFSVAMAAVAITAWRNRHRATLACTATLIAITLVHAAGNQIFLYRTGRCTSRGLASLEARHLQAGRPPVVLFEPDPGAASALDRIIAGRNRIGSAHPVVLAIAGGYTGDRSSALVVRFSEGCLVY